MKLVRNPRDLDVSRLCDALNASYGGGWDIDLVRWYQQRPFAGRSPDILLLVRGDEPVAGNAINYRQLRRPDGAVVDVGVVTGSWTLPHERRRGHFGRLMQESADCAAERGCPLLLGFVTEQNPSSRGMARAGARMIPTSYLTSVSGSEREASAGRSLEIDRVDLHAIQLRRLFPADERAITFHYGQIEDWLAQFLERPFPVEVLRVGAGSVAIVETAPDTDRLQLISGEAVERSAVVTALVERAHRNGRNLFMFSTADWAMQCSSDAHLELRRGFMTCLPTSLYRGDADLLLSTPWDVHSGDRM